MKRNIDPKKIKQSKAENDNKITFSATLNKQIAQNDLIDYFILFGDHLNN